jgi:hypothetical protein
MVKAREILDQFGFSPTDGPEPAARIKELEQLIGVQEVIDLLDSDKAPRNMVCIGFGHFGRTTCLSVAGLDHGQVFSLDTEMPFYWDKKTLRALPHLDPTIRDFFRLRDGDELPPRPWGYENCYHVADSFTEFVGKMHTG